MQKFAAIAALASVVAATDDVPKMPSQRMSAQPKQKATEKPASSLDFMDRMTAIENAASNGGNVQLEEQKMVDHQNGGAKKYQHEQDFDYGLGNLFGGDDEEYDEGDYQGYNNDYNNQGIGNLGGLGGLFGKNEFGNDLNWEKMLSQIQGRGGYDEDVKTEDLVNEEAGEEHKEAAEAKKADEQQEAEKKAETKRSPSFLRGDKNSNKVVSPYSNKEEDKTADAKTAQTAGGEIASKIKDEIVNAAPAAVASAAAAA